MAMISVLNAVAVTLFIAVVSVIPATLLGSYVPGVFQPGLRQIAIVAWIAGLLSWWISRTITRKQIESAQQAAKSNSSTMAVTVGLLAFAVGLAIVFHFYGDKLLG